MLREFLCCGSADGLKSLTDIDSIHVISQDQQSLWAKQARPVVLELFCSHTGAVFIFFRRPIIISAESKHGIPNTKYG